MLILKIQGSIVDLLMPPLTPGELAFGFIAGSVTRGVLVGLLVDEVFGLQEFMHDTFEAADEGARDAAVDFTEGCFTNAGEIWQVFNVKTLVSAAEFAQAAA